MTETGWQAIGRIARLRRERLGLKQEDLAQYGGPGVSTVGKFERAAQDRFPLRTQHQMENALGWNRTIVEQVVNSIDQGELTAEDWEHDLIEEDIPDLSAPSTTSHDPALDLQLEAMGRILALVPAADRDEALRHAVSAMLPLISVVHVSKNQPQGDHSMPDVAFEGADGNLTVLEVKTHQKAARTMQSRGRALRRQQDEQGEESQDDPTTYDSQVIDTSPTNEPRQPAGGPQQPDGEAD